MVETKLVGHTFMLLDFQRRPKLSQEMLGLQAFV